MRERAELIRWVSEIYESHYKQLHDLGMLFASHAMARESIVEDAIQDVFLILLTKADQLVDHPNITGWLIVSLRNKLREQLKKEQRNRIHETFSLDAQAQKHAEPQVSLNKEALEFLLEQEQTAKLTELLGEENAQLFQMYCINKIPAKTVAKAFGISESNVRVRANRIREKLLKHKELFLVLMLVFIGELWS